MAVVVVPAAAVVAADSAAVVGATSATIRRTAACSRSPGPTNCTWRTARARAHNLYLVKVASKDTIQLTKDGAKYYSFGARDTLQELQQQELNNQQQQQQQDDQHQEGGGGGRQGGINRDPRVRANVTWSPDSKAFSVTRMDQRKVGELFLVNNIANPRPTLMSYSYAMPGEENVGQE